MFITSLLLQLLIISYKILYTTVYNYCTFELVDSQPTQYCIIISKQVQPCNCNNIITLIPVQYMYNNCFNIITIVSFRRGERAICLPMLDSSSTPLKVS